MSRCFPFPPPGYTLNRASNDALIESIKLQKEREKAKPDRVKDKKRLKDEKKKLKKEKAKLNTSGHDAYGGKCWGDPKDLRKERKVDTEPLEGSSITEEHELPQNQSYSSDSTQNSNKRKRHASAFSGTRAAVQASNGTRAAVQASNGTRAAVQASNGTRVQVQAVQASNGTRAAVQASNGTRVQAVQASNGTSVQGNILRIRLPSQRSIPSDVTGSEKQLCSTSGRIERPNTNSTRTEPDRTCSTSVPNAGGIAQVLPLRPDSELRQPHFHQTLAPCQEDLHGGDHASKRHKKMQRVVQKYTDLIDNWIPPSQQVQFSDVDDQEWLFGKKNQQMQKHPVQNDGMVNQISCSTSASLWPSAQYLPGADIYALPYTIPF